MEKSHDGSRSGSLRHLAVDQRRTPSEHWSVWLERQRDLDPTDWRWRDPVVHHGV